MPKKAGKKTWKTSVPCERCHLHDKRVLCRARAIRTKVYEIECPKCQWRQRRVDNGRPRRVRPPG